MFQGKGFKTPEVSEENEIFLKLKKDLGKASRRIVEALGNSTPTKNPNKRENLIKLDAKSNFPEKLPTDLKVNPKPLKEMREIKVKPNPSTSYPWPITMSPQNSLRQINNGSIYKDFPPPKLPSGLDDNS